MEFRGVAGDSTWSSLSAVEIFPGPFTQNVDRIEDDKSLGLVDTRERSIALVRPCSEDAGDRLSSLVRR